ncbi:DUF2267 domain-containing protein [Kitasatospora sp. NPDC098663]|uniref:DUF2267 domain-containing protein n=1 Tax=Kitasatospora sp. NPDC098663 TaxID=3364096 RepID=UPI00381A3020
MTRYRLLLQQVRNLGRYTCDEEAERVLDAVLALLGSQLTGDERCDLAAALPEQARAVLAAQIPLPHPVTAPAFVESLAHTLGTSLTAARWDASSVLAALTATPTTTSPTASSPTCPGATPCCSAGPTWPPPDPAATGPAAHGRPRRRPARRRRPTPHRRRHRARRRSAPPWPRPYLR